MKHTDIIELDNSCNRKRWEVDTFQFLCPCAQPNNKALVFSLIFFNGGCPFAYPPPPLSLSHVCCCSCCNLGFNDGRGAIAQVLRAYGGRGREWVSPSYIVDSSISSSLVVSWAESLWFPPMQDDIINSNMHSGSGGGVVETKARLSF